MRDQDQGAGSPLEDIEVLSTVAVSGASSSRIVTVAMLGDHRNGIEQRRLINIVDVNAERLNGAPALVGSGHTARTETGLSRSTTARWPSRTSVVKSLYQTGLVLLASVRLLHTAALPYLMFAIAYSLSPTKPAEIGAALLYAAAPPPSVVADVAVAPPSPQAVALG